MIVAIKRHFSQFQNKWHRLQAFLYPTSSFASLPCQLVWQEAKVRKLDTAPTPRTLTIFTRARRPRRRARLKIGTSGLLRRLAYEPYSPARQARGGPKDVGYKKAGSLGLNWRALLIVFALTYTTAIAQDTKQGLARPEWQLRADLEFRLACQSSLQTLCLEVIQTHQKDPTDPANSKLLVIAGSLLETTDGKLPTALPEHPASIEYVKARKAAVIEWNKAYKAKGRDLPAVALDSERKFQDVHRDINDPSPNSSPDNAKTSSTNNQSGSKTAEKKLEEATVKSAVNLIKEIDKYRSTKPAGDTTLERDSAKRVAAEAVTKFVENQPDYYFTYPIRDVSGDRLALYFTVEEPVEFKQIRKELGAGLLLTNHNQSIHVDNVAILKTNTPIKPGDLLRVRFRVRFAGLSEDLRDVGSGVKFAVRHSAALGNPSLGAGQSIFVEKNIIGFQLIKQSAKTAASP